MARKSVERIYDDFTGEDITGAAHTVTYALDGKHYSIDLSEAGAEKFRGLLTPYVEKSSRIFPDSSDKKSRGRRSSAEKQRDEEKKKRSQEIRDWAKAEGIQIGDAGQIKAEIKEKFYAAHPDKTRF